MTDISNMISELARAKDALELVPKLQSEVRSLTSNLNSAEQRCQDREISIVNYKREIEELHAKVRSLEVERDEAGFHALEADDRAAKALKLVRTAMDQLDQTVTAIEPPKPEPTPVVEAVHSIEAVGSASEHFDNPTPTDAGQGDITYWGQSEPLPTHVSEVGQSSGADAYGATPTVHAGVDPGPAVGSSLSDPMQSSTVADTPSLSGAYAGKRYIDIPGYVSRFDWLSGGGTEADYDYRG